MLSKILTGGFILIMIGAIVAGAIAVFSPSEEAHASTRASELGTRLGQGAQAGPSSEGQGQGRGQGQGQDLGQSQGQGRGGQGQGQDLSQSQDQGQSRGQGRGQGLGQGQGQGSAASLEHEAVPQDLEIIEGTVVETDELVVKTTEGETVQVGLGPSTYREAQGFVLNTGDTVRVSGYWEDDEFKATELENQTAGQSIVLRDAAGRPMWAGQGRGKNRSS